MKKKNKKGGQKLDSKEQTSKKEEQLEEEQEQAEQTENQTSDDKEAKAAENTDEAAEAEENPQIEEESVEDKLKAQLAEANDKYLRLMAEYDNFRKRSAKERLELSDSVVGKTIGEILPVYDNFERALQVETEDEAYKQGVEMIFKQFSDALKKLGVEIIDPTGEVFDPNVANAVSQLGNPDLGENIVAQVFQKGYKIGGKVIRYAMVAVANP